MLFERRTLIFTLNANQTNGDSEMYTCYFDDLCLNFVLFRCDLFARWSCRNCLGVLFYFTSDDLFFISVLFLFYFILRLVCLLQDRNPTVNCVKNPEHF